MSDNPLRSHFRQPKLYFKLPSQGRWWRPGSVEIPDNGELAVMSMTGKDELLMKNADALMNGNATVDMIQSCIPEIKDAWSAPRTDLDSILIAIRIATYGPNMETESKCPHCEHINSNTLDCRWILENIQQPESEPEMLVDGLLFKLRPVSYRMINQTDQDIYEEQRILRQLNQEGLSSEQRKEIVSAAVRALANKLSTRLAASIDKIVTDRGISVTDPVLIADFIANCEKSTFDKIREGIESYANGYALPKMRIKCDGCNEEYESKIEFDPGNFFAPGS